MLLAGTLLWHLGVLRVGLSVFLGRPAWRVVVLYALFVYGFPLLILTALLVAFSYVF